MILNINDVLVQVIGDPHQGKTFVKGVPLHRRGDREQMQREDFQSALCDGAACAYRIVMGDLFDKFRVANEAVKNVADDYSEVLDPNVIDIILAGNHDLSKNTTQVSSFELLSRVLGGQGVYMPREPMVFAEHGVKLVVIPFNPTRTATEVVDDWADLIKNADCVFGHWDVVAIHNTDNLIPAAFLKAIGVKMAVTGHDHNKRELVIDGLKVIVTGSLQPYSHAEDPDERIYVTLSTAKALAELEDDDNAFSMSCLRVVGDWPFDIPNCLQFQVVPEQEVEGEAGPEVGFEAFEFDSLWKLAMEDVDPGITEQLREKFVEIGGEE